MLFLLNHIQKVFREKKDFKILMCFHSERIQLRKQDEGTQVPDIVQNLHLCSINCQHIFFSLPPPTPLNPSGKQQSSRPRLVPSSNTRSRSSQLASRIQRGVGGEMMQLPSNRKEQKQLCSRPRLVPRQKQDSQLAHCI